MTDHGKINMQENDERLFGDELVEVVLDLIKKSKHVIVAGLSTTFDRQPFTPIPILMSHADTVNKLSAVCSICGADAVYHKRITKKGPRVDALVADPGFVSKLDHKVFQARCRRCFHSKP